MSLILDGTTGVPVTTVTGTLPVANGGSGVTTSTGSGAVVLGTAPTITGATITVAATAAPAFSAYQSVAQTLSSSTATKLNFQTEEFDTNNNFDSTTNMRFTPTVAGYYQVSGCVQLQTTNSTIYSAIYKNGSIYKFGTVAAASSASNVSSVVFLNGSTDYVELYGYFSTGQNAAAGINSTWFNGAMVRSA